MAEIDDAASVDSLPAASFPERLTLSPAMLLPWLALVVASYWIIRALAYGVLPLDLPLTTVLCACGALGIGTQLAGLGLLGIARVQRNPFPLFPGERLWIYDATTIVLRIGVLATLRILVLSSPLISGIAALTATAIYLHGSRTARPMRWKVVFTANAVTQFSLVIMALPLLTSLAPIKSGPLAFVCLYVGQITLNLIALGLDLIYDRKQSSWHWIGAVLPLWNALVLLGTAAIYIYIHDVE